MITRKSHLVIAAGLSLLALAVLGYRGFVPAVPEMPADASSVETRPDQFEHQAARIPDGVDLAQPAARHPLQSYVLSMPAPARESLFVLAIRDAGSTCDDLLSAVQMAEATPVWRVACVHAAAYLLEVDLAGQMRIEPLHYGEGLPAPIIGGPRAPDTLPAPTPLR